MEIIGNIINLVSFDQLQNTKYEKIQISFNPNLKASNKQTKQSESFEVSKQRELHLIHCHSTLS